jgi:adenine modification enzyme
MLVKPIISKISRPYIQEHHYSHRAPAAQFAFGLFEENDLVGVITFGKPSSPQIARSLAPEAKPLVLELNRLAITTKTSNAASKLIGVSLRLLKPPFIIVSFADRGQSHVGYVYQATNFWFAGESRPHDSEYLIDGKRVHPRTLAARGITAPRQWARENGIPFVAIEPKFRYVYYRGVDPALIKWALTKEYPKGDLIRRNSVCARKSAATV